MHESKENEKEKPVSTPEIKSFKYPDLALNPFATLKFYPPMIDFRFFQTTFPSTERARDLPSPQGLG
jgi:hypothetical protein